MVTPCGISGDSTCCSLLSLFYMQAYWDAVKRMNDKKKAEAAAEAKRRKALTKEQRAAEDKAKEEEEERKKQEDEEMTLRKETVIMRGNGVDPVTVQKVGGMVYRGGTE